MVLSTTLHQRHDPVSLVPLDEVREPSQVQGIVVVPLRTYRAGTRLVKHAIVRSALRSVSTDAQLSRGPTDPLINRLNRYETQLNSCRAAGALLVQ